MKKLVLISALALGLAGCQGDYFHSNRCVARDTNHTFTRALIHLGTSNVVEEVVAWQDYQNSDSIQLWVKDARSHNGVRVIYTHLENVILENPQPEHLPKFNKVW